MSGERKILVNGGTSLGGSVTVLLVGDLGDILPFGDRGDLGGLSKSNDDFGDEPNSPLFLGDVVLNSALQRGLIGAGRFLRVGSGVVVLLLVGE